MKRKFITAIISTAVIGFIAVLGFNLMLNNLNTEPIRDTVSSEDTYSVDTTQTDSELAESDESEVYSVLSQNISTPYCHKI